MPVAVPEENNGPSLAPSESGHDACVRRRQQQRVALQDLAFLQVDCSLPPWSHLRSAVQLEVLYVRSAAQLSTQNFEALPLLDARSRPGGAMLCLCLRSSLLAGDYKDNHPHTVNAAISGVLKAITQKPAEDAGDLFAGSHLNCASLYPLIKPKGDEPMFETPPPGLIATLRPFQVRPPLSEYKATQMSCCRRASLAGVISVIRHTPEPSRPY
jgi:hypothetical protein